MPPPDIMCNGHKFVKSSLFQSPGYLADLSPYISAVISSRLLATPIQLTANAIKPLAPLAHSILPSRATNFILNGTLTCEYCLHQVSQDTFDDGRPCPSLLLDKLGLDDSGFVLADQLLEAQDKLRLNKETTKHETNTNDGNSSRDSANFTSNPNINSDGSSSNDKSSSRNESSSPNGSMTQKQEQDNPNSANPYKNDLLIMRICPEIGLHAQKFLCIDCEADIDLTTSRLCHYDGRHYCFKCHTGSDLLPIPARVLRNWDFTPKPVSRKSLQKICFLRTKPVLFNLFQINSMLYGFIDRLVEIKQVRERVQSMLKYIEVCGQPDRPNLVSIPKHFLESDLLNFFTLNDLLDINHVHDLLNQFQTTLEIHITRKCESCRGKGYYCELCQDPHDILYPFSKGGSVCSKCHTVYHKNCFHRKKKSCPKCYRISTKKPQSDTNQEM